MGDDLRKLAEERRLGTRVKVTIELAGYSASGVSLATRATDEKCFPQSPIPKFRERVRALVEQVTAEALGETTPDLVTPKPGELLRPHVEPDRPIEVLR